LPTIAFSASAARKAANTGQGNNRTEAERRKLPPKNGNTATLGESENGFLFHNHQYNLLSSRKAASMASFFKSYRHKIPIAAKITLCV
jgi:hypothetical protein